MCKPSFYDIEYEINPWMSKRIPAERLKASVQWQQLYDTITKCGSEVVLIEPQKGLPDMVFTANAGLAKGNRVLLSAFRHPERQGERHFFKQWFIKAGYQVIDPDAQTADFFFEGEGDALFSKGRLFAGYGIRSDKTYYANTQALCDDAFCNDEIIYCELVDPYFYHLDTCFSPLNGETGIWWPHAFNEESQKAMTAAMDLIAIPEKEAKNFACNAVLINKNVIIPSGCPQTARELEKLGYQVYACDMSEYIKSGGACKCLTMFI